MNHIGTVKETAMITQETLKTWFNYDPISGTFHWAKKTRSLGRKSSRYGKRAGHVTNAGYRMLSVTGVLILEHRAAWIYMYGHGPKNVIDHINGVRDDNRLCNLRDVTQSVNARNRRKRASNSDMTLPIGVSKIARLKSKPFEAKITINKKCFLLGRFSTAKEAGDAYAIARDSLIF